MQAHTEEDLKIGIEKLLDPFIAQIRNVRRLPSQYEHATSLGGIADALHGNVVIEYERPGKLAKRAGLAEATEQLQRYLIQVATEQHGKQATAALRRMVGVGLDGREILFVRYRGRQSAAAVAARKPKPQLSFPGFPEAEIGDFSIIGPDAITAESVDLFLSFLESLGRYPLTPDLLAQTFGPERDTARNVVGLFYNKLVKSDNRRVQTFFAEWQRIFGIVYGQEIEKAATDARALGKQFGIKYPKLKEFLFAVHTYFALLMKFLAAELMTLQQGSMLQSFLQPLSSKSSDDFRRDLKDLEDGGLFSRQGINNLLEGDFFAWYLSEWDKDMARDLRGLVKELSNFDARTPYLAPEQSRDLLKKLYQYLVPKKLRHDLGEYYTPDWLADHLLNQLEYDGNLDKRLLDPACGSGTFLVLAINRMKRWADEHDPPIAPKIAASKILENLCGFDLNPIAVIAARTNFLLALGELVRYIRPIEIPVYMCDSVLTPAKHRAQKQFPEIQPGYEVPTRAGTFVIPREIVDRGQMDKFAGIIEDCVKRERRYPTKDFIRRVEKELGLGDEESRKLLQELYRQLCDLETDGRNRIWARFIKNSFAPVFKSQPRFDFVAGNPPWVNWENLAEEYRRETKGLWRDYGFFTQKGYRAVVPAGKLELAALFSFVSSDAYLTDSGKLGFVITQSVFKTRGAGEGFRKFVLPGDVRLGVSHVDDFVELKPFEGAANRTATVILHKGVATAYPVQYAVWRPKTEYFTIRRLKGFEPGLQEVELSTSRLNLTAIPVAPHKPESPWLTVPRAALSGVRKVLGSSPYKAREGVIHSERMRCTGSR